MTVELAKQTADYLRSAQAFLNASDSGLTLEFPATVENACSFLRAFGYHANPAILHSVCGIVPEDSLSATTFQHAHRMLENRGIWLKFPNVLHDGKKFRLFPEQLADEVAEAAPKLNTQERAIWIANCRPEWLLAMLAESTIKSTQKTILDLCLFKFGLQAWEGELYPNQLPDNVKLYDNN